MNPFARYPQHPDAHPVRPWWRYVHGAGYTRVDGKATAVETIGGWITHEAADIGVSPLFHHETEAMDAYDAAHPLPCPEPACGQVWAWDDRFAATVQAVDLTGTADPESLGRPGVVWPCTVPVSGTEFGRYSACWTPALNWPPALGGRCDAVLVSGPGAPWAPAGWTPAEGGR